MPATIAEHTSSIAPASQPSGPLTSSASVAHLSNQERAVALYASDMPLRFLMRPGNETTVLAWILQGVARLGLAEVRRSAAYAYGYRLLWLADLTTHEQDEAHRRRFANERRWDRAERLASAFTVWSGYPMTQAAKDRARCPEVEGACLCGGAGWIVEQLDPNDPTTRAERNCPGHNPEGRSMPRAGVSV